MTNHTEGEDTSKIREFHLKDITPEVLVDIKVMDWIEGIGDVRILTQAKFINQYGHLLHKLQTKIESLSQSLRDKGIFDTWERIDELQAKVEKLEVERKKWEDAFRVAANQLEKTKLLMEFKQELIGDDVREYIPTSIRRAQLLLRKGAVMYGCGRDDGEGGFVMWEGPSPSEKDMLEVVGQSLDDVIIRFNADHTEEVIWRWFCGSWIRT